MIIPGAFPSPPDLRDFVYSKMIEAVTLPPSFDLVMPPVRDQGQFGTCVAFASAGIKDFQESQNYPGKNLALSPLFIYSESKKLDGIPGQEGTYPRVAMSVLKDKGVCLERSLPYEQMSRPVPAAPANAYDEARQFQIGAYARIYTIDEIKQAIYRDGPVLAAVFVCSNFASPEENKFIDHPDGTILGGHAVALCGWDDNLSHTYGNGQYRKGFLRLRNSWGTGWGQGGYAWLPYDFLAGRDDFGRHWFMEAWSSVDVILPPPQAQVITLWVGRNTAIVDGATVGLDQPATLNVKTGRTLVPLRFLSENMGYIVEWDDREQKITLRKPGVPR